MPPVSAGVCGLNSGRIPLASPRQPVVENRRLFWLGKGGAGSGWRRGQRAVPVDRLGSRPALHSPVSDVDRMRPIVPS